MRRVSKQLFILVIIASVLVLFITTTIRRSGVRIFVQDLFTENGEEPWKEKTDSDTWKNPIAIQRNSSHPGRPTGWCSHIILRDYILREKHFPGDGQWSDTSEEYKPNLCSLRDSAELDKDRLSKCFLRKEVESIVLFGDSQVVKYMHAIEKIVGRVLQGDCTTLQSESVGKNHGGEGYISHDNYYKDGNESLVMGPRPCHTCESQLAVCSYKSAKRSIFLEYLVWFRLRFNISLGSVEMTYEDFVLKKHLPAHAPSHLIVVPPFNHLKRKYSLDDLRPALTWFVDLLDQTVDGAKTQIYFVPPFAEFEGKKAPGYNYQRFFGELPTKRIDEMNSLLVDVLSPYFARKESKMHGFFDLLEWSRDRVDWTVDGVHMQSVWYEKIMAYFFQVLCED